MEASKYLTIFIGVLVLVAVVAALAPTVMNSVSGTWNGTAYVGGLGGVGGSLTSTGLGSLFGVGIFGLIIAAGVFYALWTAINK